MPAYGVLYVLPPLERARDSLNAGGRQAIDNLRIREPLLDGESRRGGSAGAFPVKVGRIVTTPVQISEPS